MDSTLDKNSISQPWQLELNSTAYKYHIIVIWIAIILNPIWAIGDYYTIPAYFTKFLIFRLAVAFTCIIVYLFRHKFINKPEIIAFVPFMGIAIQNAYMYSVMNVEELQKHTFAYIALFIGAGMMVLWNKMYSIIIVVVSLILNIILFKINSSLLLDVILINGALLTATVAIFTIILINTRYNLTLKEIIARLKLSHSNELLEEKNKSITDSINYAKNIQYAIVPDEKMIQSVFPNSFLFYKPKDIVSGDFPFVFTKNDCIYIASVDCTGHGVPGAFMSLVGYFSLSQAMNTANLNTPSEILDTLHTLVVKALGQDTAESTSNDGMDIALCKINTTTKTVEFSGAHRPLYIMKNGEFEELKSDKFPIGGKHYKTRNLHANFKIELSEGDSFYFFTDGLQDQFGGPTGKTKLMSKNIKRIITENHTKTMTAFKDVIVNEYETWKGDVKQIDDVLMIGCKF